MSHVRASYAREPGTQISSDEFQAFECEGNEVEWRIVENDYCGRVGEPRYFVYRVARIIGGRHITEYLQKDGRVSNCGSDGHFDNYQEIGMAFILNHANEKVGGARNYYTNNYWNWLSVQYDKATEEN
jgi:hypothetical protein